MRTRRRSAWDLVYWLAVTFLVAFIMVMLGLLAAFVGIPELERAGIIGTGTATRVTPSAGPVIGETTSTASPIPSGMLSMAGALVPEKSTCAGCHTTVEGAIGVANIPRMAHPTEGWSKCTNCHATSRLVDTAPGHSGIHATECTVCHKPGQLQAPLSRPHRENQNLACLSCHGSKAPLPEDMTHRKETVCWLCHRLPTVEPPVPAHQTAAGESDCRTCHTAGGKAGALPDDHVDRPATLCLSCHEVTLGASAGASGSPRIVEWPAPSATALPPRTLPLPSDLEPTPTPSP